MTAVEEHMIHEEEADDEVSFAEVDKLTSVGINTGDVKKLKEGGFHTVASVIMATSKVDVVNRSAFLTFQRPFQT